LLIICIQWLLAASWGGGNKVRTKFLKKLLEILCFTWIQLFYIQSQILLSICLRIASLDITIYYHLYLQLSVILINSDNIL